MFEKTTTGEWVVIIISIALAIITTFAKPSDQNGSYLAGTFIGTFVVCLIVLYFFYWLINKFYPKSANWGTVPWVVAIIVIPLIIVMLFAVIAAFIFGMAGSVPTSAKTTEISQMPQPIYTTGITNTPSIVAMSRPSIPGWNKYTIPQTRMGIYFSKDWTTSTKVMSYGGKDYTVLFSYSPDFTTAVGAFSMDVSGIFGGPSLLQKSLDQGYIDSDTYQGVVTGLTSSSSSSPVFNVIQDPTYYTISGYPARKIEYDQENGHFIDYIVIPDKNTFIFEFMTTTNQVTSNDNFEADESLKSISA